MAIKCHYIESFLFSKLVLCSLVLCWGHQVSSVNRDDGRNKVIGGSHVDITHVPYVVLLRIPKVGNRMSYCSGSIISEEWVLTAAHCFHNLNKSGTITILAGIDTLADERLAQTRKVPNAGVIINPSFHYDEHIRDVALLWVKSFGVTYILELVYNKFILSSKVNILSLGYDPWPQTKPHRHIKKCKAMGWGQTEDKPKFKELRIIDVYAEQGWDACKYIPAYKRENLVCLVLQPPPKKGMCDGDSGSPLVCDGKCYGVDSYIFPAAINTRVTDCTSPNIVTVYAYLYPELQWIGWYVRSSRNIASCAGKLWKAKFIFAGSPVMSLLVAVELIAVTLFPD